MRYSERLYQNPAGALAMSFAVLIIFGTFLLSLPFSSADGNMLGFVDSFFTATSAVCVTGLIVKDTATQFSLFGKGVILSLIQLGGLGIMTLSTATTILVRRSMTLSQRKLLQEIFDQSFYDELMGMLRGIVRGTVLIEFAGAIILTSLWWKSAPSRLDAIGYAVFHSISAFCNAGFSVFSDSFVSQSDPFVLLTISALIIIGGLGFVIIGPLLSFKVPRFLHARLALVTTAILLFAGTIFFFFFQFNDVEFGGSLGRKILNSFFLSVTARTAGFNSTPMAILNPGTILVLCLLMFIGASSGSTGGGIKTTTFATLFLSVRAWLKRRTNVEVFGRQLSPEIILKALTVALLSISAIFIFTVALTFTEKSPLYVMVFEAFSAFGTVGLSLGLTPQLTVFGKLIITILMYIGRVGPITIALLLSGPRHGSRFSYPTGHIMIG